MPIQLSDLLKELEPHGIGKVGTWQSRNRKGITLGDPRYYFPYPTGPQVPVDTTKSSDPVLPDKQADAIRRRFGLPYGPASGRKRGPKRET